MPGLKGPSLARPKSGLPRPAAVPRDVGFNKVVGVDVFFFRFQGVEYAMLARLGQLAVAHSLETVRVGACMAPRNQPVLRLLARSSVLSGTLASAERLDATSWARPERRNTEEVRRPRRVQEMGVPEVEAVGVVPVLALGLITRRLIPIR